MMWQDKTAYDVALHTLYTQCDANYKKLVAGV